MMMMITDKLIIIDYLRRPNSNYRQVSPFVCHTPRVFLMFGTDVTRGTKSNKPPAAVWSDVKFYCFVGSVPLIVTHETVSQFSWLQMDLSERKALIQGFSLMFVPLGCAVF